MILIVITSSVLGSLQSTFVNIIGIWTSKATKNVGIIIRFILQMMREWREIIEES